jgi:AhpD family alkylhydroperoxidase
MLEHLDGEASSAPARADTLAHFLAPVAKSPPVFTGKTRRRDGRSYHAGEIRGRRSAARNTSANSLKRSAKGDRGRQMSAMVRCVTWRGDSNTPPEERPLPDARRQRLSLSPYGRQGSYGAKPARLRMNRIVEPKTDKVTFELVCLAVSAINGCEVCIQSHERAVIEGGLTEDHVHDAVRIAATMRAAAIALEA